MIKSAGHLIGPFEVESALMEHPAVAEAGVIGKPDEMVGEVVKAFVSLKQGFEPSEAPHEPLRPCAQAARRGGGAEGDRLPSDAAAHAQRQDHAPVLKARELACPKATPPRWRPEHDAHTRPGPLQSVRWNLRLLADMLRIRRMEEKCAELHGAGRIRGFLHLYIGEEARHRRDARARRRR